MNDRILELDARAAMYGRRLPGDGLIVRGEAGGRVLLDDRTSSEAVEAVQRAGVPIQIVGAVAGGTGGGAGAGSGVSRRAADLAGRLGR